MQTRRKSLNLADLGVVAPKRSRTTSHPSPPETVIEGEEPPAKKSKRSYTTGSPPLGLMSPPRNTAGRGGKEERNKPAIALAQLSPPPSPAAEGYSRVDTEGIKDDIVVGVIQQLEETGNRPHLVRELAAVLATSLRCVEKSANQSALISSRLTAYLQRPWPAVSPCPLAKEISTVHPRRLYYHLTTLPRQPIPTHADHPPPKPANRIMSPSLSSAPASEEDDDDDEAARDGQRDRQALSPSPEVDLSSPEFEEAHGPPPPTPGTSFSGSEALLRTRPSYTALGRASPPLEHEERDFKMTATALHERAQAHRLRGSQEQQRQQQQQQDDMDTECTDRDFAHDGSGGRIDGQDDPVSLSIEDTDDAEAELFNLRIPPAPLIDFSSPVLQPQPRVPPAFIPRAGAHVTTNGNLLSSSLQQRQRPRQQNDPSHMPPRASCDCAEDDDANMNGRAIDGNDSHVVSNDGQQTDEHSAMESLRLRTHDLHLPDPQLAATTTTTAAAEVPTLASPSLLALENLRSPEDVDIAELEDLFEAY